MEVHFWVQVLAYFIVGQIVFYLIAIMLQKKIQRTNIFILNLFYLSCEFSFLTGSDGIAKFFRKLGPLWKLYFQKNDIEKYLSPEDINLLSCVVSLEKDDFKRFTDEYVRKITYVAYQIIGGDVG